MTLSVTIADDSRMSRRAIIKALPSEWDVDVHEAENGIEALRNIRAGKAEVLFLDLQMPEMDGFQVLDYLHEHKSKIITIVISADIQPESQKYVLEKGAFRFLKKPLSASALEVTLREVGLL